MTLYALDAIDDAITATKTFLWPFDLGHWARLALIVFFLGGAGSGWNPFQYSTSTPNGAGGIPDSFPQLTPELIALIGIVVAAVALLALLFVLVGSIMDFVFVEALRHDTVRIRQYWREDWRLGVRLFGFRLGIGIITLAVVATLAAVALVPLLGLVNGGAFSIGFIAIAVVAFFFVALIVGLITGFTRMFIVPIMLLHRCGVLAAWRQFWPTLTGQWKQYAAYAILGFILHLIGGFAAGIVSVILGIILAIPFVIVGLLGAGLLTVSAIAGWIVIGIVAVTYGLVAIVMVLFVMVPVHTYLRYYALLILGDTNDAFDIIPDQRAAIREELG